MTRRTIPNRWLASMAVVVFIAGSWAAMARSGAAGGQSSNAGQAAEPHSGENAAATTDSANVDPQALEVLRAAGRYLSDAKSFTFSADVWEDVVFDGRKVQRQRTSRIGVRRPDGVYAESHNERIGRGMWYDGKSLTIYNRRENVYGTIAVPDTIHKTLDVMEEKFGMSMPLADLIDSDVYAGVMKKVRRGDYLGRQTVNGVRCHHLAFVQDEIDWEMWIEDGHTPVICKLVITYKNDELAPQFSATLSDWNFEVRLTDYAFTFAPPLGATKIEVLPAKTFEQ